jgi:2-keto-3-deoxy-L-rhamnonate aldolase RhmA
MRITMENNLLSSNKPLIGSWITLAHPAVAEIMAKSGFDWLAVDLEHSVITIREAEELIRVIDLSGVVPLVRLTSNNSDLIKRVMDSGAHGIIVPMVNNALDAKKAVQYAKYPPTGTRGVGLARAQKYGAEFDKYKEWQESGSTVIVQIEHIEAVNNFREILLEPGVDGFIVGPYDLSSSMGIPGEFSNPKYLEAIDKINKISREIDATGGIHIIEPEPYQLKEKIKEGYKFIAYSLDIRMLDFSCRNAFKHLKES